MGPDAFLGKRSRALREWTGVVDMLHATFGFFIGFFLR